MANWSSTLDKGRRDKRRSRGCPAGSRWRRAGTLGACALGVFMVAACDELLVVELPGQLRADDLDNPRLAELLVRSVQGDFDCALSTYVWAGGLWANDLYQTNNSSRSRLTQLRSDEVLIFEQDECDQLEFPQLYLPFQIVRFQGEEAVRLIEGFPDGEVEDKDFLLGIAHAYTGYAYEILGETMCNLAFDGGPLVTRQAAMELAKLRFTSAITHASLVTSGSNAAEALEIVNMAYVGRARASLNLGDVPGVLADAGAVDAGFVRLAEMDGGVGRRWNQVHNRNERSGGDGVIHPSYGNLMVGGVADPRVEVVLQPDVIPFDKMSEVWYQFKYPSLSADIPFSSWREAQLMIAEVDLAQSVGIIDNLRAVPWGLAAYAGGTTDPELKALVWEERRRELFLQGTKIGDMLRVDIPTVSTDDFETGVNQRGKGYGPHTCYPLPDQETLVF